MEHQPEETLSEPINKKAVIAGMILSVAILFVPGFLLRPFGMGVVSRMYWLELARWLEVGLLYLYARKVEKMTFTWEQAKGSAWFYVKETTVVYALAMVATLASLISLLFVRHEDTAIMNRVMSIVTSNMGLLIFSCITAGFTEEMLCRAYLVPRLSLFTEKRWVPVVVSAVVFGGLHYGYHNLHEIIFAFFIGLIMAWHYQRYQNIYVLMAAHFLIDFGAFMIARYHQQMAHMGQYGGIFILAMILIVILNFAPGRPGDQ